MAEMTGGQALVRSIYNEGVRVIFGLPGVQLYHAMDALYDVPEIRFHHHPTRAGNRLHGRRLRAGRRQDRHGHGGPGTRLAERRRGSGERLRLLVARADDIRADQQEEHRPRRRNPARDKRPAKRNRPRDQVERPHPQRRRRAWHGARGVPAAPQRTPPTRGDRDPTRDPGRGRRHGAQRHGPRLCAVAVPIGHRGRGRER